MFDPHPITPQDVVEHYVLRDANISPNGRYIAFCVRRTCKDGTPELPGVIWLADIESGKSRQFTFGRTTDQAPRWSPDSKRLAFLSDRARPGQRQVYLIDVEGGGEARVLTDLKGHIDWPTWSPDGRAFAFLYVEDAPEPLTLGADIYVEDEKPQYVRAYAVDVETQAIRPLTPDGFQIHEMAWSPTGDRLAAIARQGDPTPSGWYTAQLYVISVTEASQPGQMQQVCSTNRQICAVTWSPDGKQLAYLTSIISDQPLWSGDVCIVDAAGGEARQITPGNTPMSFTKLKWTEPDRMMYSARQLDGTSYGSLTISTGQIEPYWSDYAMIGDWTVPCIDISADGRTFATILERPHTPSQVWTGSLEDKSQAWKQVSQFTYTPLKLGNMVSTKWGAPDGLEIVGHIVYPVDYEPGKRYPTFVQIHGGPAWGWLPHYAVWWEWWYQYLAGRGYLVFLPNIRGSTGRGTAYTEANVGDMGGGDWQDIMTGVDHLIAMDLADPDRLGIGGWSYGGFMTAWAVSQTTRFKAAVMGAGVTNWESYYAQNGIRDWQRVYFKSTPYEDLPAHRAKSPINFIQQAKTPTLILHGQEDHDVPVAQAYEIYVALKEMGVETQLVTYPRQNHPILERQQQIDLLTRVGEWCDRHMKV